jgi:hypothetical protein
LIYFLLSVAAVTVTQKGVAFSFKVVHFFHLTLEPEKRT